METNNKLGFTSEEELMNLTNDEETAGAAATPVISAVTAVVSAVFGATWALCPTGACTSTGYCK